MNKRFFLFWRFLGARHSGTFSAATIVAIVGMTLGVAALFVSLAVIGGFQRVCREAVLKFNAHLVITEAGEMEDPEALIGRFPSDLKKEMTGWSPFLYREGMVVVGDQSRGIVIKGIADNFAERSGIPIHLTHSTRSGLTGKSSAGKGPRLILGKQLSTQLKGPEQVRFLFPKSRGRSVSRFDVGGVFESGLYEYDSSFAFLPLAAAQDFFRTGGKVSGIEIWLQDPDSASAWAERLKKDFEFPFLIMTWREINENLFRALEIEKAAFFILMASLLAVATLNILASLIIFLNEKKKQIAILRVLGLPWGRVRKIFLFDGLLIGSVGLGAGLAVAVVLLWGLERWQPITLAPEVYFVDRLPIEWAWDNFLRVVLVGFVLVGLGCGLTLKGIRRMPILRSLVEG